MTKLILSGFEAKKAIKAGIDKAANTIKVTLGPTGRSVLLDKGFGGPIVTDDGVTVAKEIELEDKFENTGAALIKEVAEKTNDEAGDGTTTATVLAQKMIHEAINLVAVNPANSLHIKRGMDKAVAFVVEQLKTMKKDVKTKEEIEQVATIASLDPEVGKLIAEAMQEVGHDGVITVEEGQTTGLEKEVVKGMRFDKGYVSPYMVTNPERMEAVWENPYILITDKKISSIQEVLPLLEKVAQSGKKDLVIIADDIEGEALATFLVNKLRGTFNVLAIKTPGFGDRRKEMLGDIAVLTGGEVITEDLGLKIDTTTLQQLGRARKVISNKENTTIVDGGGDKTKIETRITQIKSELAVSTSDYEKEKLQERLARLAGGVAVIKVGAFTETEMKAKKFKIEDALNATKAAVQEGILPGGGLALAKVNLRMDDARKDNFANAKGPTDSARVRNEDPGWIIVSLALTEPMRQIAINSGVEPEKIIYHILNLTENMKADSKTHIGYDFGNINYADPTKGEVDMIEKGIVDPFKVTRLALENAASIASTLLTTEAVVVDKPEPKSAPMGGGGMGGMGMDY